MAKDLPEYQRRETIKPAAAPVGMANVASASTAELVVGAIGAYASQQAAQEYAQYSGKKAGKVPGQKLLPNLTPNIKSYNEAYREESAKVLLTQGDNYLNNLQKDFNALPAPTGMDIAKFDESATQGLSDLLRYADPKDEQDIRRAYFQKFSALNLQAADRVQKADVKRLIDNYNVHSEANLNNIYNFYKQKMPGAAEDASQDQIKNLETARPYIGEDKYIQGLQTLRMAKIFSEKSADIEAIYEEKGELAAIKYIQDFAKNAPEGFSYADRDVILPQLYNKLIQTQKVEGLSDKIEYGNAQIEMAQSPSGILPASRIDYYQEVLSAEAFNDLKLKQLSAQKKNIEAAEVLTYMNNNAGNAVALNSLKPEQLDIGFKEALRTEEERRGAPSDLNEQAKIASAYDVSIPQFKKNLTSAINSKNPGMAGSAAQLYSALALDNPNTVKGVDDDTAYKAGKITKLMRGATPEADAINYVNNKLDNLTKAQIDENKKLFEEAYKDKMGKNISSQNSHAKSYMGFEGLDTPPGFLDDFQSAVEINYVKERDWDLAVEIAVRNMKQVYKETDINGYKEVMFLPPDIDLPTEFVREQFKNDIAVVAENEFQDFEYNPESPLMYRYELIKEEQVERVGVGLGFVRQYRQPGSTMAYQIDMNGNKIKGQIIISPDRYTQFPEEGQQPSYGILFLPDGRNTTKAIQNVILKKDENGKIIDKEYSNARFIVSNKEAAAYKQKLKSEKEAKAKSIDEFTKYQQDIRHKVITMRLEEGEEP